MTLLTKWGTATVEDDGRWRSSSAALEKLLNAAFPPELHPDSPSDPMRGWARMRAAAKRTKGRVSWTDASVAKDEGTVY